MEVSQVHGVVLSDGLSKEFLHNELLSDEELLDLVLGHELVTACLGCLLVTGWSWDLLSLHRFVIECLFEKFVLKVIKAIAHLKFNIN